MSTTVRNAKHTECARLHIPVEELLIIDGPSARKLEEGDGLYSYKEKSNPKAKFTLMSGASSTLSFERILPFWDVTEQSFLDEDMYSVGFLVLIDRYLFSAEYDTHTRRGTLSHHALDPSDPWFYQP